MQAQRPGNPAAALRQRLAVPQVWLTVPLWLFGIYSAATFIAETAGDAPFTDALDKCCTSSTQPQSCCPTAATCILRLPRLANEPAGRPPTLFAPPPLPPGPTHALAPSHERSQTAHR